MVLTSSRILSCEVWLILMRNTSAPASNSLRIIALSEEAGPSVARILIRRRRLMACFRVRCLVTDQTRPEAFHPAIGQAGQSAARRARHSRHPLRLLFRAFGQLHRPGALLAGVDLEEAGAVETARQAILGALDGEFLVARTHEGLSRPFAAAVVVERVDVIEPCDQRAAQQGLAAARGHVPPALGGPALGVLVAERDADPARRVVAEPEIGRRRDCSTGTTPPSASAGIRPAVRCERRRRWRRWESVCDHSVEAISIQ